MFLEKKFFDLTITDEGRVASPPTQYDFKTKLFLPFIFKCENGLSGSPYTLF